MKHRIVERIGRIIHQSGQLRIATGHLPAVLAKMTPSPDKMRIDGASILAHAGITMSKLRTYTAVICIGNGNGQKDGGFYRTTLTVEASNEATAKRKALQMALSSTDVTVQLTAGEAKGENEVYRATFGDNPEAW